MTIVMRALAMLSETQENPANRTLTFTQLRLERPVAMIEEETVNTVKPIPIQRSDKAAFRV